ncbi:MAG: LamG-like jellyroll fold domain-containing protein [bacterium]
MGDTVLGYWKFDDGVGNTFADSSGNNHDGTKWGATWTSGQSGAATDSALHFDRAGSYDSAKVEYHSDFDLGYQDTTIALEACVYLESDTAWDGCFIVAKHQDPTPPGACAEYALGILANQRLIFMMGPGPQSHYRSSVSDTIPLHTWTHVRLEHTFGDGSSTKMFFNHAPVSGSWDLNDDSDGIPIKRNSPITIGYNLNYPYPHRFDGKLDEVKITRLNAGDTSSFDIDSDSAVVRNILDIHGYTTTSVASITTITSNRITGLNLSSKNIDYLPTDICHLNHLKNLNVSSNNLTYLPQTIRYLVALQELDASNNDLTQLPDEICELTSLGELKVNGNDLTSLPDNIGSMTGLYLIYAWSNNLTSFPSSIGDCPNLHTLWALNNQISTIPSNFWNASEMKSLHLGQNAITTIPDDIGKMTKMDYLNFSSNNITDIPDTINSFSSLKHLYINNNDLDSLPALGSLAALQNLVASDNTLDSIKSEVGNLSSLIHLDIHQCGLTSLPLSLGNLTSLVYLYINGNQLTSLPDTLTNLNSLSQFYFHSNDLTSIPDSIGRLSLLTGLGMSNNDITTLPNSVGRINNLTSLLAGNNEICSYDSTTTDSVFINWLDTYDSDWRNDQRCGGRKILSEPGLKNKSMINLPKHFVLYKNNPNPFTNNTLIKYDIPAKMINEGVYQNFPVTLGIWDMAGKLVKTLVDEMKGPGYYNVVFNPHDNQSLSAGTYIVKIKIGNWIKNRKITLVR